MLYSWCVVSSEKLHGTAPGRRPASPPPSFPAVAHAFALRRVDQFGGVISQPLLAHPLGCHARKARRGRQAGVVRMEVATMGARGDMQVCGLSAAHHSPRPSGRGRTDAPPTTPHEGAPSARLARSPGRPAPPMSEPHPRGATRVWRTRAHDHTLPMRSPRPARRWRGSVTRRWQVAAGTRSGGDPPACMPPPHPLPATQI